jgi:hypothetical protein
MQTEYQKREYSACGIVAALTRITLQPMNNTLQIPNSHNRPYWPACIGVEEASRILGWPPYFLPLLARARHLKPLGKPAQNGRKWFATVEIERLGRDIEWLDKAVRIVEKHVHDANLRQHPPGLRARTEDQPDVTPSAV